MLRLLIHSLKQILEYTLVKFYNRYVNALWALENKLNLLKPTLVGKIFNRLRLDPNPSKVSITLEHHNTFNLKLSNISRIINRNLRPDKTPTITNRFSEKHD